MSKRVARLLKRNPLRVISFLAGWFFARWYVDSRTSWLPVIYDTIGLGIRMRKHKRGALHINGSLTIGKRGARKPYGNVQIDIGADAQLIINGDVFLGAGVHLSVADGATLTIGSRQDGVVTINHGTQILAHEEIRIDSGCMFSWDILLMDSNVHTIVGMKLHQRIHICEKVWIGCRALVLKGVTAEPGSVIGAGAVVVKNVPANAIVAGNPAQVVKEGIEWLE